MRGAHGSVERRDDRSARVAAERVLIEEAEREIEEGRGITGDVAREILQAFADGRPITMHIVEEAERR